MRSIYLKSLSLVNFKGIRNLEISFNEDSTVISGCNGTGKTTVFDAFCWLLFGKDSTGRSDSNFSIKTINPETGKPILKLEHSVEGVLLVDGEEIKLQRVFKEKWSRPKNSAEEVMKNHETEFYLNGVKLGTKREYETEISNIISEDVFKMITNPFFFTSLKADAQKEMLLDMAGDVTDDEVAKLKPEYVALLAELAGRSLEQRAKEVAVKKKACKDVLAVIPAQIETANKLIPEPEDWEQLEKELEEKKTLLANYDAQIADRSNANKAESDRKVKIQREIGDVRIKLANRENEIRRNADSDRNAALFALEDYKNEINAKKKSLSSFDFEIRTADNNIKSLNSSAIDYKRLIDEDEEVLMKMVAEYRAINAEKLTYDETKFVCPTCGRPLEDEDIESKKAEMQGNFNADKAKRLKINVESGKAKRAEQNGYRESLSKTMERIQAEQQNIEDCKSKSTSLEAKVAEMEAELEKRKAAIPAVPDVAPLIEKDTECIRLKNQISELENQLTIDAPVADISDLLMAKDTINESIQELYKLLAKRETIERANNEVKELEEKRTINNQQLADLEKWEYTATNFQKDKDAKLLSKINGLFKYVSFSFLSEQLNGGEKITCICTVNGTPYPDANKAAKVNAGLDIINAICTSKGVTAPIFIDNSESVNEVLPTSSQIILLKVTLDKQLTINE